MEWRGKLVDQIDEGRRMWKKWIGEENLEEVRTMMKYNGVEEWGVVSWRKK